MKNGKQIKVAILGAGTMGRIHADSVNKSEYGQVAGVHACDETGFQLAKSLKAPAVEDAAKLIKDPNIDAIVIACPTDIHARYLRLAQAAGKHIFCEKPLVRTSKEADEIERAFKNYKKVVAVGHVLRFSPVYQELQAAAKKTLGNIGTIRLGRCGAFPRGRDGWFADYGKSGGVILDLMLHDIDVLRWCFGEVERIFTMRLALKKDAQRDYAIIVARMKSGAIAHLEGSWAEAAGIFYFYYEVAGSKGLVEFDSRLEPTVSVQKKSVEKVSGPGVIVPQSPTVASPYEQEMWSFLECIAKGKKPVVSLEDGLAALRIAHAAIESAEQNRAVLIKS